LKEDRESHQDKEPRSLDCRKERESLKDKGSRPFHARKSSTSNRHKKSDLSEPRINSTASEESIKSSTTGLSIVTEATSSGPPTLVAMNLGSLSAIDTRIERFEDITMDDRVPLLSPVDADIPSTFFSPFGRRPEGTLKSSIGHVQDFGAAQPNPPTFVRPTSPKSRNSSRARQPEYQKPALNTHYLAQEPLKQKTFEVKSPLLVSRPLSPNSAFALPEKFSTTSPGQTLRPRPLSTSPCPKSSI